MKRNNTSGSVKRPRPKALLSISRTWSKSVRRSILSWSGANQRVFPWRETRNPFHIVVAEILLRRTQATRVIQPYFKLIRKFPSPETLSSANVEDLREVFRPLGLVQRTDQLLRLARVIVNNHHGRVPRDLGKLLQLPGLGTYSARAVMSLAFGERVPMLDESSGRVLRRLADLPKDGPAYASKSLLAFAEALLPRRSARRFNLGLLDLAASNCRPRVPLCDTCPLCRLCRHAERRRQSGVELVAT